MKLLLVICLCLCTISAIPSAERKPVAVKKSPEGRIVGGDVAKVGQFPYQVAVYFDTDEGTFFCGGALIDIKWVLTSAHCVYHASVFTLHLGANSLVSTDSNRVTIGVSHSVVHPDYNPNSYLNDIGLIRIDNHNVTLNNNIKILELGTADIQEGATVTVSGWGASGDWDGAENDLHFVNLKTISNEECSEFYGRQIEDDLVCAVGPNNEGTCDGDNGSPLVTTDNGGHKIHVGIVTFTSSHGCLTNHPSGFTRTYHYLDWIRSVISEDA